MTDRTFENNLSIFIGLVNFIRDEDYHGRVLIARENGIMIPKRTDCSNENLQLIKEAIAKLRKLKKSYSSDQKILVYTKYQIQFVGQCFLDRLWSKHDAMKDFGDAGYSWDNLKTRKQMDFVSTMIRHEKVIRDTLSILASILKLRASVYKSPQNVYTNDAALYVLRNMRRMVLFRGFSSSLYADQRRELPNIWNRIRRHYIHLLKSYKWKTLVKKLENAQVNVGRPDSFSLSVHRKRMRDLIEKSTENI